MKNNRSKNEESFDKCFLVITYWKGENPLNMVGKYNKGIGFNPYDVDVYNELQGRLLIVTVSLAAVSYAT